MLTFLIITVTGLVGIVIFRWFKARRKFKYIETQYVIYNRVDEYLKRKMLSGELPYNEMVLLINAARVVFNNNAGPEYHLHMMDLVDPEEIKDEG